MERRIAQGRRAQVQRKVQVQRKEQVQRRGREQQEAVRTTKVEGLKADSWSSLAQESLQTTPLPPHGSTGINLDDLCTFRSTSRCYSRR